MVALMNLDGAAGLDAIVTADRESVGGEVPGYRAGALTSFVSGSGTLTGLASWSGVSQGTEHLNLFNYGTALARRAQSLWE